MKSRAAAAVVLVSCALMLLVWLWSQGSLQTTAVSGPPVRQGVALKDRAYAALLTAPISLPDRPGISVTLKKDPADPTNLSGEYVNPADPADRAYVTVPLSGAVAEIGDNSGPSSIVLPVYVNYGGSGTFLYVGLFALSGETIKYQDAVMIDDRVPISSFTRQTDGTVLVRYKARLEGEPMATEPTHPAYTLLSRAGDELRVLEGGSNTEIGAVTVGMPAANSAVPMQFTVEGSARGPWYFEASFPVEVTTSVGEKIGGGAAQAEGEWMTTDLVPFKARITVDAKYTGPAFLFLRNSNPSGDVARDMSVFVPITISK